MVKHTTIALLIGEANIRELVANAWGKKGSTTDISLYSIAKPLVQTTVVPETYPSKPLSLVFAAHMANAVVIGIPTTGINAQVGEAAILADTLQLPGVLAVIANQVGGLDSYLEQATKMFGKLNVSGYPKLLIDEAKLGELREKVIEAQAPFQSASTDLIIETDHAFPVQGVGSVILGTVTSGTVTKGQKVKVYPGGHVGTIKSIQVNDINEKEANIGVHVGIALRGILDKNLRRGSIIVDESQSIEETDFLVCTIRVAAFNKGVEKGLKVHIVVGLLDIPGEVLEWKMRDEQHAEVQVKLEKPIPIYEQARVTILDLNAKQRVLGSRIMK